MDIPFDRSFSPCYGEAVPVAADILRVTAENPGPFTFHGTNSYVVGSSSVIVVDPGPDAPRHLTALMSAIGGRDVAAILLTHTHRDHTGLVEALRRTLQVPVLAEGPHRAARPLHDGEVNLMDAAGDRDLVPDRFLSDGEVLAIDGMRLTAVATPGHTVNHFAFAVTPDVRQETGAATDGPGDVLLSGDHVMAWSTSIVAPPDGAMSLYMASLDRLLSRSDRLYLPGHGGPVEKPQSFVRGLRAHRLMRESAILERLRMGDRTIPEIVRVLYRDLDPTLHAAAGLSVLAHLEDLVERGRVATQGGTPALIASRYAIG